MPSVGFINWDWKTSPDLDDLRAALTQRLGVFVYQDPAFEDSDQYGFVFSLTKLSESELLAVSEREQRRREYP
jgi:hypothetical protein